MNPVVRPCFIADADQLTIEKNLPASPFRYQENLIFTRQSMENAYSAAALLNDTFNVAILGCVHKMLCATEYQVTDALLGMGIPCRYADVRARMLKMQGAFLLEQYVYSCDGHAYSHNVFCLSRGAEAFMPNAHANPYRPSTDNARLLKLLAANQFLTKFGIPLDTVKVGMKIQRTDGGAYDAFRPQAIFENEGRTIFVEGVRREPDFADELKKKLARADSVCKNKAKANLHVENPYMLLVAEDTAHCQEIMHLLERERYSFRLWYTADDLVYKRPEHCLYEISCLRTRVFENLQQLFGM